MALEAVIFEQDPFNYGCFDVLPEMNEYGYNCNWESSSAAQNSTTSSSETVQPAVATHRKRRRTKPLKNKEEMESQRMTHIAVERNRRRQMNDYLALLRSLMPPSYSQRVLGKFIFILLIMSMHACNIVS